MMDQETRERGEEDVNYASIVFKNISASKGEENRSQKESHTVHGEVIFPNGAPGQMTPAGGNDQKQTFKYVSLCLGILCVIMTSVLIALSSNFFMKSSELANELQHSKENQSALLEVVGNLKSAKENLMTELETKKKELNRLNFTCAQSTIDAYCRPSTGKSPVCRTCEDGWNKSNSTCYVIMDFDDEKLSERKTWAEARDNCRGRKADLVVIDNKEEQQFVYNNSYNATSAESGYWLGLSDPDGTGAWRWVDGTQVTQRYWGKKNDTSSSSSSHCAITWRDEYPRGWSVVDCAAKNRWICEKPALSVTVPLL